MKRATALPFGCSVSHVPLSDSLRSNCQVAVTVTRLHLHDWSITGEWLQVDVLSTAPILPFSHLPLPLLSSKLECRSFSKDDITHVDGTQPMSVHLGMRLLRLQTHCECAHRDSYTMCLYVDTLSCCRTVLVLFVFVCTCVCIEEALEYPLLVQHMQTIHRRI